jgi:uncharacterized membrane protein YhaH (DUF805 family)
MATGEKNAAALGVDRLAGNIAPALHLRGGGGVASVGGRQGKGQRQQRNHACKRGGVLFLHAAMVQGGHEEWLNQSCLSQYATFSGRASRSEFWWFFLFQILALIVSGMLGDVAYSILALLLLLPALAVGTRRLHDVGRSGWWQLLTITGIGYLVLLYWFVQPSQAEANGYGESSAA